MMIPTGMVLAQTPFNDILSGTNQKDTLKSKDGNDIVLGFGNDPGGGNKPETLDGGNGNDELIGDANVFVPLQPPVGAPGDDKLNGGNGDDFIAADQGDDELIGGQGAGEDVMHGGAGNDGLVGGNGDDELHGGSGDDVLQGGNGDDFLFGGLNDDDLTGGNGADFLDGGFGNDICRVTEGLDTWVNCETVVDENTGEPIGGAPPPPPTPGPGDSDSDGLTDDDETNIHGTDPFNPDTDGDGLSDGAEVNTHLTDPLNMDSDSDGLSDGVEVGNGTDPNDPNDPPSTPTTFDVQPIIDEVQLELSLSNKDRNQLTTSLNTAQSAADDGDLPTACSKIGQFDQRVNRLLDRENVTEAVGLGWLADSNAIQVEHCGATPI